MIKVHDEFTQLKEVVLGNVNKHLVKHAPKDEQSLIHDIFDQTSEDLDAIEKIYEDNYVNIMHKCIKYSKYHQNFVENLFTKTILT